MNDLVTVTCRDCSGNGEASDVHGRTCECGRCEGRGVVRVPASVASAAAARVAA
jgi:DnaJ-class molecular chaperone